MNDANDGATIVPAVKTYAYGEVLETSLRYFKGDELAAKVFSDKYAMRDLSGKIYENSPDDMHRRMAAEFSWAEEKFKVNVKTLADYEGLSEYGKTREHLSEEKIYELFKDFKYAVPQGSVMTILGNKFAIGSLSNCIVLPELHDSYAGILYADQQLVQLMKRRCGVGLDLSPLRPDGTSVSNAAGSSTGPVSFMHRFSNSTREVAQCYDGDTRIMTDKGLLKIRDIVDKKIKCKAHTHTGDHEVVDYFDNGPLSMYEVETEFGKVVVSKNHNFISIEGSKLEYKPLYDISVGDSMLINAAESKFTDKYFKFKEFVYKKKSNGSNRLKIIGLPTELNEDLAYFLGLLYADGCIHKNKRGNYVMSITVSDIDVLGGALTKLLRILNDQFPGINPKVKAGDYGKCKIVKFSSNMLARFLEYQGISKDYSDTVRVPEALFVSPKSVVCSFLAGFFDGDGSVIKRKDSDDNYIFRGYKICTNNRGILEDMQLLLSALGIPAAIKLERDAPNILYKLHVVSSEFRKKFFMNMDGYSCKISLWKPDANNANDVSFYYPESVIGDVNGYKKMTRYRTKRDSTNAFVSYKQLSVLEDSHELLSIVPVEIISIKYIGERNRYDITVVDEHKMFANGIYASNSGRRGALMITIDVAHPDVAEFVTVKQDLSKITGANISVKLSDEFMEAVRDDKEYTHRWPIESADPKIIKTVKARVLWESIINSAWKSGEPGLIMWDRQHLYSTSSVYPEFKNISTNPCSEIGMGHDSCRLLAVNLLGCVNDPYTSVSTIDYKKLYEVFYESQRLMDDLVELELEAVKRILSKVDSDDAPDHIKTVERVTWEGLYDSGKKGRRTGLGYTALADTIAAIGLKFDSDEALVVVETIMRTKLQAEFDSSIDMAIERGQFGGFDPNIENTSHFIQMLQAEFTDTYKRMMLYGRRNISISTVAPTGSLSILTQTSSGIEPVYMLSYTRRKKITHVDKNARVDFIDDLGDKWQEFTVYHPQLKRWMDVTGLPENESPWNGATAPEIDWIKRVKMQSVIQKYITHSISSTINLPADVLKEKVGDIYMQAWQMGLKGITVYRDGSRAGVLVEKKDDKKEEVVIGKMHENHAPRRPKYLDCDVQRFSNKGEKWIGFVGLYEGRPYEVFTGRADDMKILGWVEKGKIRKTKLDGEGSRYDFMYLDKDGNEVVEEGLNKAFDKNYFNLSKMLSGILRHSMPLPYVVDLVSSLNLDDEVITTWKNGVARMIKRYIPDGTAATDKKCKECKSDAVVFQEGCLICTACGSSKCGS